MSMDSPPSNSPAVEPWLQVLGSRHAAAWLAEVDVSLAFTTYQTGKLFLIGRKPDQTLAIFERTFNQCMGLWASADAQSLWMSSQYQLWRFENALAAGQQHLEHDRLYVPRIGYTTGNLDIHDIAIEADGRVVFVNTQFGCLATLSERSSFTPLWRPPFLSKLVPEDRCHLNGLALRDGQARYVTAVSESDVTDGWRDRRRDGGCVIDVRSNDIVARGLSMPHSPRWYRDQLWVLNAGTGHLGRVDLERGKFEPLTFCPGFLRGLAFVGNYALVTLSKPRRDMNFDGLELDEELARRGALSQCGLHVIDLTSGNVVQWFRVEGMVSELYDVVCLPGVQRPMALGFKTDEIQRMFAVDQEQTL
ncbi:MAG: hypothetical protein JWN70_239 [Planctomycetaceae bacterium]|nr:hypothetical protein [Planctomycetaceae bacterium]